MTAEDRFVEAMRRICYVGTDYAHGSECPCGHQCVPARKAVEAFADVEAVCHCSPDVPDSHDEDECAANSRSRLLARVFGEKA